MAAVLRFDDGAVAFFVFFPDPKHVRQPKKIECLIN
jgi:hypothetical protein